MRTTHKALLLGTITILVVLGASALVVRKVNAPVVKKGTYCLLNGTLSDIMPTQSHRSYCIKSTGKESAYAANTPTSYRFVIIDNQGDIVKNFAITHTKPLHLIVVRKDLKYFQHPHPTLDASTGEFTLSDLTFPAPGEYRIFADFAVLNGMGDQMRMPLAITISEDIKVENAYTPEPLGTEERVKMFDGNQVTLSTEQTLIPEKAMTLVFDLKQNGKPITDLEPYLGALGHSIILRDETLDFIHAHPIQAMSEPQNGKVSFSVDFPEAGTYKIFTQFQRNEKVFTTDYVVTVAKSPHTSAPGVMNMSMPEMDHTMH